ncbi:MAG: UDP-N-acetylglucosamine--N-acetylmuramyl-(pentapeptide) pyrophosphoryl-undecaprenol N-acetylglucosamine transferase [Holosporales bacterium]|jgi:UDP-N-acetylglucosamine--N-acetylmuramyl-(pentapeptide) pyrophosphoryl-undecaprenol N-acetylglucosamine transferase|nr:UDP-N-acetylglucosamine--N-acetylmuramyl-(pentapeptide) pyrophosphoryl-undecaprenol N-acetylglucosamine transferase [Holosporales bacterium]
MMTHIELSSKGRIIFCAAGTGGHVFPALSVFAALKDQQPLLLTDPRGAAYCQDIPEEEKLILDSGKGSLTSAKVLGAFLKKSYANARYLNKLWHENRPSVVVGFGGRSTFIPLLIACKMRIPTLIHEQNAVMGRTNRVLSYMVTCIMLSFPETRRCPKIGKRYYTGMPIRSEFLGHTPEPLKKRGDIRLCILGGSQGAHVFSSVIPRALILLPEALRKRLFVVQQVQEEALPFVEAFYTVHAIRHELFCFSDRVAFLMKGAHLVICRAGASSLAELAALACPTLMIPYPHALDDHQKDNAYFYAEHRAGWCILEQDFTPQRCADFLVEHLVDISSLENAGKAMHTLAKVEATEKLVSAIVSLKQG